jgi:hypothetical protein
MTKIYYNTSNVGIGTLDPVVPLHIYNNTPILPTTTPAEIVVSSGASVIPNEIVVAGTTFGTIGATERFIQFPYSGTGTTKDYTFTTTENLICDILIVGGGGAGGTYIGGGGGAGGVLYIQNATVPAGTYNINVGKGGTGFSGSGSSTTAQNGSSSKAFGIEVFGGGFGGAGGWGTGGNGQTGSNGGSGGGGGSAPPPSGAGVGGSVIQPSFTSSVITVNTYNYYGGVGATSMVFNGNASGWVGANGGGGASGNAPANTDQANAGAGADGVAINITGTSYFWGGGGGGGQYFGGKAGNGGKGGGGGGNGSQITEGVGIGGTGGITLGQDGDLEGDGTPIAGNGGAGTGGGGGGTGRTTGSPNAISGSGGSGIVIIRYRKPPSETVVSSIISGTTDRYISFPYSGTGTTKDYTITTTENLNCDILVVGGGGGGGGAYVGGGGGGGGYLYLQNISVPSGNYTVNVGRGGIAGTTGGGGNGSNSSITGTINYIALGGGGGAGGSLGGVVSGIGNNGGSGGGGSYRNIYTVAAAAGTSTQLSTYGYGSGGSGNSYGSPWNTGGGGGGASGATNGTSSTGNNGLSNSITGTSITYAGGGGGGVDGTAPSTGGTGGGGGGANQSGTATAAVAGTDSLGGGGGGSSTSFAARGGSGIVIIRYRKPTIGGTSRLLIDTTTTAPATLEFRRGTGADTQNDYRFINDTDTYIKLQMENSTQSFGNTSANLVSFSSNETIIHKNTSINSRVGIGTVYHSTRSLDVLGDANISGAVSVGGLSIFNNNAIITNSLTNNTSLTIQNSYVAPVITSSPAATTTGTTGAYTYQVFTYTSETGGAGTRQTLYNITISGNAVCDILMVGGGGAGGKDIGGGGGGGAVLYGTNITIPANTYEIRVGDGATAGETRGKSTTGFGATLLGGGCAGNVSWGANTSTANSGGSGAGGKSWWNGGSTSPSTNQAGGVGVSTLGTILTTATLYNGNLGGAGVLQLPNNLIQSGGGGGAGAVGGNGNTSGTQTGNGGSGVLVNITGNNLYWGAGGGAGSYETTPANGGLGGGGAGYDYSFGSGTVGGSGYGAASGYNAGNGTGSGGGGSGYMNGTGGKGGSGIVIIRYLTPLTTISSSIEFIRGTAADANRDYKLGNYNSEFKVISSTSGVDTDYVKITTAGAITNPTGTASWNTGSDRRIKENIERASYDKCFDNINKLELNRFNYIDGFNTVSRDNKQLGFIAQEVYDIFPKAISSHEYNTDTLSIPNLLSIDVSQINYSLYGAVKKLIKINEEDEKELSSFDNRIKTIKTILNIAMELTTSNLLDTSSNVILDTSNHIDT